jgi:two-component system, chemotaxis family, CheB/CheR fusion protein
VVFEALEAEVNPAGSHAGADEDLHLGSGRIGDLEKELQNTRESHQTTIEELESTNEELKSTNEELQSSNEELQSTNEELESSKEELQSLNEELQTVNAELQSKVDELSATHDDMRNLLNSTEIATVFVDNTLHIRRYTQEATAIINFIPTDIGRPLKHVVSNLCYDDMISDLDKVLSKLTPKEIEVQTADGDWYNMRIVPYRTIDNRIDGAVLTFSDISEQKKIQARLSVAMNEKEQERALVRTIFDMNTDPMVVIDAESKMEIANQAFSKLMGKKQDDISGMDIIDVLDKKSDRPDLASKIRNAVEEGCNFSTEAIAIKTSAEKLHYIVEGRIIKKTDDSPNRILLRLMQN